MDTPIPVAYLDTSVVGGFDDDVFANDTQPLFARMLRKEIVFMVSDFMLGELSDAPEYTRTLLEHFDRKQLKFVYNTPETQDLAATYIQENVIGKKTLERLSTYCYRYRLQRRCPAKLESQTYR
jgi:hypothetical protein